MTHDDHVALIRDGVPGPGGVWADLGAGSGAFTLALADLIGPTGQIIAIDRDARALAELTRAMRARFPAVPLSTRTADLTGPLDLAPLDGAVLANSLHFLREKGGLLDALRQALTPGGRLILVEYGTDRGNPWVPYPLTYPTWERLAQAHGFVATRLLARRPSRFLGEIYAAGSQAPSS
jgi:SAM-dependent methyltransferase